VWCWVGDRPYRAAHLHVRTAGAEVPILWLNPRQQDIGTK
jgi:hypothetical protein